MIFGMILGAVSIGTVSMDFIYKVDFLFLSNFKEKIASTHLEIFTFFFVSLAAFSLAIEFATLSFFGLVFVPALIFSKAWEWE